MAIEKLAALCALLLAGCAATPKGGPSSKMASAEALESAKSEKICTREKPLGSNLPRVVCYTRQQLQRHALSVPDPAARGSLPGSNRAPGASPIGPFRKPNG